MANSLTSCLCAFRISHFDLYYLYSSTTFLNRKLSPTRQRKETVKKEIPKIYDNSKQNYGAPKIAQELRKSSETISQRTVGKYIRAQ